MGMVRKVSRNTAMNPVARAIARKQLSQEILTNQIALYMMDAGTDCRDMAVVISLPIYAVTVCLEDAKEDTPDVRKLKSACSVLRQLAESGFRWQKEYVVTLDNALEICQRRWSAIPAMKLNKVLTQLAAA